MVTSQQHEMEWSMLFSRADNRPKLLHTERRYPTFGSKFAHFRTTLMTWKPELLLLHFNHWPRKNWSVTRNNYSYFYERFQVFTDVTKKNVVLEDVTRCGSCKKKCFGRTYCLYIQGEKIREIRTFANFSWPEDGIDRFFRNVGSCENHTSSLPRRRYSS